MDILPILFLVAIVLISGFIAVGADWLGRTVGKKRLKVWKLRPKHTAALGVFLGGVVASLLTIALAATLSSGVREWILRGTRAIAEARSLQTRVDELGDLKDQLEAENRGRVEKIAELDKRIANQRTEIQRVQGRLEEAQVREKRLAAQVQKSEVQVQRSERDLRDVRRRLDERLARLAQVERQLRLSSLNAQEAANQLREAQTQGLQLLNDKGKLEREVAELQKSRGELETSIAATREELAGAREARDLARQEVDRALSELASAQSDLQTTRELVNAQRAALETLAPNARLPRTSPLIFRAGEEVARIQIEPMRSKGEARAAFRSLMQDANRAATLRGLTVRSGTPVTLFPLTDASTGRTLSEDDLVELYIEGMALQEEPLAVIATTEWNQFQGEQALVRLRPYRNPLVYEAETPIADLRVDGRRSEEEIVRALNGFLTGPVRDRALKDSMIPIQGAESTLGSVTDETLLDVVRRIRRENRVVTVTAVVRRQTRAADPLELAFRVR